jgi:murein DD-endopeptidase MepM/ murein hydrolase activator NlpD
MFVMQSKIVRTGLLVLVSVVAVTICALGAFRVGPLPTLEVKPQLPVIGRSTPVTIVAAEPVGGLSTVRVEVIQGERVQLVAENPHTPRAPWQFWGTRDERDEFTVDVGRDTIEGLVEGPATIRVTAERAPAWLRSPPPAVATVTLDVKVRPPTLELLSSKTYAAQGGSEAVVYRVSNDAVRDGVQAGDWFFPGFPVPGRPGERFALFGVPYDLEDAAQMRLVAVDAVENGVEIPFVDKFFPKPFDRETIELSESFITRVVPSILANAPGLQDQGSPLANYLMVNRELRRQNSQELIEYATKSKPQFLWSRTFMQIPNAKVMSSFADRRTYLFDGREVDQQDHLGFDLASTKHAEIPAVNDGVVIMAKYFGIYGNTVLIDHGYGLASLYGHLSEIRVKDGDTVARGQVLGRSGQTGLAGGDHLHFTILLRGLAVNPREWWDSHWIHDRLKLKLGDALPFNED